MIFLWKKTSISLLNCFSFFDLTVPIPDACIQRTPCREPQRRHSGSFPLPDLPTHCPWAHRRHSLFFRDPGWWASFSRHVASARSFHSAVPHWEGTQGLSLLLLALLQWVKDLVVAFSLSFCPNGSPRYLTASQWKVGTVVLICYFVILPFRNVSGIHWIWLYIYETQWSFYCSLCKLCDLGIVSILQMSLRQSMWLSPKS